MTNVKHSDFCPCGSQRRFDECCGPVHQDPRCASTPEALMRARYTAFVMQATDVLLATWDPQRRPSPEALSEPGPRWIGLTIENAQQQDGDGSVTFRARFVESGRFGELCETSRFRFSAEDGHWRYVDGDAQWHRLDIGRNTLCPCGSGLKAKRCCARG
ncbi:YchJ family protein [Halomonas shantousis]